MLFWNVKIQQFLLYYTYPKGEPKHKLETDMRIDRNFVKQIKTILSPNDIENLEYFLESHIVNSDLTECTERIFLSMCKKIKQSITYDKNEYTLRRVIVGSLDPTYGHDHENKYDLKNILRGRISSSNRRLQSWTMLKSSSFILKDRYETLSRQSNSAVMIMMEKTFSPKDIVTHIPSLVQVVKILGYNSLYDDFFREGGLHQEKEVLVKSSPEIKFEKLWFFKKNGRESFKKIPYSKTSGTLKIPIVEGENSESTMLYF
jgi:hypothetical protein